MIARTEMEFPRPLAQLLLPLLLLSTDASHCSRCQPLSILFPIQKSD